MINIFTIWLRHTQNDVRDLPFAINVDKNLN